MTTEVQPHRGPTGETVRANLKRLRDKRNLSLRALAKLTEATDHPLGHGSLNQIEQGRRRVDVDDLMTLAFVLNVPPLVLLLPHVAHNQRNETVQATGVGNINAGALWGWSKGQFQPIEVSEADLGSDTPPGRRSMDETGTSPDYRVAVGIWVMGIDQREADEKRAQEELRRTQAIFELLDLYWDEYLEYRESMRD